MSGETVTKHPEEVRDLIETRLRIKGATLEKAVARAGRVLPKWARREAQHLVQAQRSMDHPKLRMMVDEARVKTAHGRLVQHLMSIDPSERRKTRILQMLGVVSFNVIAVGVGLVALLMWRGFL